MFRNKQTQIDLTAATMTVVQHAKQALEVLTGKLVEIQHFPITMSKVQRIEAPHSCPLLKRRVSFSGVRFTLYSPYRRGTLSGSLTITRKDKHAVTRWEVEGAANLHLESETGGSEDFCARWKYYSIAGYPEVRVIEGHPPISREDEERNWRVGSDRTDRKLEPLYPANA